MGEQAESTVSASTAVAAAEPHAVAAPGLGVSGGDMEGTVVAMLRAARSLSEGAEEISNEARRIVRSSRSAAETSRRVSDVRPEARRGQKTKSQLDILTWRPRAVSFAIGLFAGVAVTFGGNAIFALSGRHGDSPVLMAAPPREEPPQPQRETIPSRYLPQGSR